MILQLLSLLGAAALFLYGLNLMSNSLLKASGDKLNRFLPWMRKNPFSSILSGFGITAIAQSSSAATVNVLTVPQKTFLRMLLLLSTDLSVLSMPVH